MDNKNKILHPSQGQVSISRSSISGTGVALYGSDNLHNQTITMAFCESSVSRQNVSDHRFGFKRVFEVEMSALQWAEMVSSFGGSGTACTFRGRADLEPYAVERYEMPASNTDNLKVDLSDSMGDGLSRLCQVEKDLREAMNSKGPVSKKALQEIWSNALRAYNDLGPNVDFVQKNLEEEIERKMAEARMEVEAYVSNRVQQLGLDSLAMLAPTSKAVSESLEDTKID